MTRLAWAELLKRVFATDALACPKCGGRMKVIATTTDPEVVRKVLTSLGLPPRGPLRAPARERPQRELKFEVGGRPSRQGSVRLEGCLEAPLRGGLPLHRGQSRPSSRPNRAAPSENDALRRLGHQVVGGSGARGGRLDVLPWRRMSRHTFTVAGMQVQWHPASTPRIIAAR